MTTIYYLGPKETFTEQAAKDFALECSDGGTLVPCRNLAETIGQLNRVNEDSMLHFAVVPYYNLMEGLIQETLDLIYEHQVKIYAARQIPITFAIGGYVTDILERLFVYSHHKALAQCTAFLQENYPNATCLETTSTAGGVAKVADEKQGLAIARREAFEQSGVPVLHENIGNRQYSQQNYTEFLLLGKAPPKKILNLGKHRTFVAIMPTIDRVGLLADILNQIAFFGINLLKIHSRPALRDVHGESPQMFYLEMEIASDSPELRLCIESMNMRLTKKGEQEKIVHILGDYFLLV